MHNIDLEMADTDDLIGELFRRCDNAVVSMDTVRSIGEDGRENLDTRREWHGSPQRCYFLAADVQYSIQRRIRETEAIMGEE